VSKVRVPHVRYETKQQTGEGTPAKIIRVDQEAVQFEKDKLEAMPNDPAQKKIVADAEKAMEAQIVKLNNKRKEKKCKLQLRRGCPHIYCVDAGSIRERVIDRSS
jgi:hypothetical protein